MTARRSGPVGPEEAAQMLAKRDAGYSEEWIAAFYCRTYHEVARVMRAAGRETRIEHMARGRAHVLRRAALAAGEARRGARRLRLLLELLVRGPRGPRRGLGL